MRDLAQAMHALSLANQVRTTRARLKEDVALGKQDAADLLMDPPPIIRTMEVSELLLSVPKVGKVKRAKLMQQCHISSTQTVESLSLMRRRELIQMLSRHG